MRDRDSRASDKPGPRPESAARDHMANARTLLAWIRTAIALMALGFVVARFGLFLRELAVVAPTGAASATNPSLSSAIGIGLVATGLLVTTLSAARFVKTRQEIERDEFRPGVTLEIVLAAVTVAGGVALVADLALTR